MHFLKSKTDSDKISISVNLEELEATDAELEATYKQIQEYVLKEHNLKVSTLYIAQVKQKYGIFERECYNKANSENTKQPQCSIEKEEAIGGGTETF